MKKYVVMLSFIFFLIACKGNSPNSLSQNDVDKEKDDKVEISFSDKISCDKGFASGDLIEDGTELTFTFVGKLGEGQTIKEWKLNGEKIKDSKDVKKIKLKIDAKKAKKENNKKLISIEVELGVKQDIPTFAIKFDETKITANEIHGNTPIAEGYKAKEGEQIRFGLKDENIKVESWNVKGNKVSEEAQFLYTVKKEDADEKGNILVDYIEKLEVYTLKFQEEKIKAEKTPENEEISPLHKVKVGETYKFSLKDANGKVEYWTCNGKKIAESAKTELVYTVKKEDASKDLSIEIAYKVLEVKKLVITFDETIENCVISGWFSDTKVKNGDSVKIGDELKITAKLLQGEEIEKWIIGEKEEIKKDKVLRYKTRFEDAKDGVINIRVEKRDLDGAIIKYDHLLMDCVNYENSKVVDPSSKVFQGMKLKFTAKLKAGFELINWAINGTAKTDERRDIFIYTVNIGDGKGESKEIEISYSRKESPTYKIVFDEQRISCCEYYSQDKKIKSKDVVHEGLWLLFKPKLGEYDEVDRWIVKGVDTSPASTYSYKVDKNDVEIIDGEKVINIGMRLKQKCKFQFDDALISCKYARDHRVINKEEGVTVGWQVVISAKLKEGEKVFAWKINDVVQKKSGKNNTDDVLRYIVSGRDVNTEGFIKLDVEIEKLKSVNLKFDSQKILCTKGNTPIQSETKLYQGEKIVFKPIKIGRGEKFENWKLNNNVSSSKREFEYTVNVSDAQDGYINVNYTVLSLTPFILRFEEPITKCSVDGGMEISNGTPVYEGEKLKFSSNINEEEVEAWLVKGVKQSGWSGYNYFDYTVLTKDIEEIESKLTLRVSCKLKEKIRIVFESSAMTCKFSYQHQGGAIFPNDIILPKKWIQFKAIVPEGKKVKEWKLNGKIVKDNSGWFGIGGTMKLKDGKRTFEYFPSIDEAVLANDGRKEIKITIEFE